MPNRSCLLPTCLLLSLACGSPPSTPDPLERTGAAVAGFIAATDGAPLPGVSVQVKGTTATAVTDEHGLFQLGGVLTGSRVTVLLRKEGYAPSLRYLELEEGDVATLEGRLKPLGPPHPIEAELGGAFTDEELRLQIPARAFRTSGGTPVEGTVEVRVAHLDPAGEEILAAPGDTRGRNAKGDEGPLASFGMVYVEATQAGKDVRIDSATVEMLLPADTGADTPLEAGDIVPLWVFDEEAGTWVETGSGRVKPARVDTSRLVFEFETPVTEQWWGNCDQLGSMTCVEGRVVDCAGNAVPRALVRGVGLSYAGTSEASTGTDGRYRIFPLRRNARVRVEARVRVAGKVYGAEHQPVLTGDSASPCTIVPDIAVPVPDIIGEVTVAQTELDDGTRELESTAASGVFLTSPREAGDCRTPPPTDECQVVKLPPPGDEGVAEEDPSWLDVGSQVLLEGPAALPLKRQSAQPSPYAQDRLVTRLAAASGGDFDLTTTGSPRGLESFMVRRAVRMPAVPALKVGPAVSSQSLALSWDAPKSPSPLFLTLSPATGRLRAAIICSPTDDGDFSVPAGDIAELPAGDIVITATRQRVRYFPTPNGMAAMGLGISTKLMKTRLE
ncbi:MAG: carboxypeptidase regulatory-like domain-containing protein [Myxococcales bacterium]|nr:carboxypeptidase regulatory-like domain-containing protein [Myxococcales bacterium]